MSWSHAQASVAAANTGATSISKALGGSTPAGNLICAFQGFHLGTNAFTTGWTCTDSAGNTYTQRTIQNIGSAHAYGLVWTAIAATTATLTVTVGNTNAINASWGIVVDDFGPGGTPVLDGTPISGTGSGLAASAGSLAFTGSSDLVYTGIFSNEALGGTYTPSGSFVLGATPTFNSDGTNPVTVTSQYILNTGTSPVTCSMTVPNAAWVAGAIAFSVSGAAAYTPWIYGDQCNENGC